MKNENFNIQANQVVVNKITYNIYFGNPIPEQQPPPPKKEIEKSDELKFIEAVKYILKYILKFKKFITVLINFLIPIFCK